MKDLDALLGQGEPEKRKAVVNNGLDSIHITEYAFEKAHAYARLAVKKAKGTIECGGYLIAPRDAQDRTATDSFLAKNQDVSDGLFTIEAEDVIKAGREINEMGYRVLGWWHSHGNLRTFFSATDDNGQRTVLNEIGAFNYVIQNEEKEVGNLEVRAEDGRIVMFDRRSPERKYEIEIDGDPSKISIAKLKLLQEKKIGFAYGLVVNNRKIKKEPYAEIATRDLCGFCRNSKDKSVPVDVTLFDTGKVKIDEDALMAEIGDRVKMRSKFFGTFTGLGYKQGVGFSTSGYIYDTAQKPKYSVGEEVRIINGFYKGKRGKISKCHYGAYDVIDENDGRKLHFLYPDEFEPVNIPKPSPQTINEDIPSDKKDKDDDSLGTKRS